MQGRIDKGGNQRQATLALANVDSNSSTFGKISTRVSKVGHGYPKRPWTLRNWLELAVSSGMEGGPME